MGCLLVKLGFKSSHETLEEEQPKVYSWDKRPKVDLSNFMYDGLTDQTVGKLPGSLNGQQFIVQNCKNCNIYLYDYTNSITVDDCVDCNFFIGPIQTSIFIRDCTGCKFVVACQQFRLRDCQKLDAFLCCATQPIIESSSGVKLACYTYYYPELAGQFKDAKLSVFNNNWSNIHDFTQDDNMKHFTLLPEDCKVEDFVPLPSTEEFQFLEISLDPKKSVVPRSLGNRRKTSDESCLIVFFCDGHSQERALAFIDEMTNSHPNCILVQTKELKMTPPDALRVFGSDAFVEVVSQGPVIGLEYNGENCIQICQEVMTGITKGATGLVFISQSRELAEEQIENYYNFADMQMAPNCILVQTKELKMTPPDALRVFGSDAFVEVVSQGPVIGLEYNGENCIQICQEVMTGITKGATGLVFISQSRELAEEQIENYYNFADMQMAV